MIPLIALSGRVTGDADKEHAGVHLHYALAVRRAGGVPIILPPSIGADRAAEALGPCGGLILTRLYGEEPHPRLGRLAPERDAFEVALFRVARERGLPILAICRGFQLVNVVLGGTLWQHLPETGSNVLDHDRGQRWAERTHRVRVRPDTRTAAALGTVELLTNSFHHQGIKALAPELVGSAEAEDGVLEAAETPPGAPWFVGVQWHPESFWEEEAGADLGLFTALVSESRNGQVRPAAPAPGRF